MVRPLRWVEPGLSHHAMNRGLSGGRIFDNDSDREMFLQLLADCGRRWNVWTQAYCLMDTHYHLVLEDAGGQLSRAMRHIDGVYTQHLNRRIGRDGPLMRGRFRSRVVQTECYLQELVRYVHANPVDARIVARAAEYGWSSHRAYLGLERAEWLRTETVRELLGLDSPEQLQWFDEYVHERIDPEVLAALGPKRWSSVLGDKSFLERARAAVRARPELRHREVGEGARLAALDLDAVVEAACEVFKVQRDDLVRGTRGSRNLPRLLSLLACREVTAARVREIGAQFGIREAAVSALASRARKAVAEESEARTAWERLSGQLKPAMVRET